MEMPVNVLVWLPVDLEMAGKVLAKGNTGFCESEWCVILFVEIGLYV